MFRKHTKGRAPEGARPLLVILARSRKPSLFPYPLTVS